MDDNQIMINKVRHVLQMTQTALAAEMGISIQHLNGVERGRITVSKKFMRKLWSVIDAHGAREAINRDDDDLKLLYIYKTLPSDKQTLVASIIHAFAGDLPSTNNSSEKNSI